MYENLRHGRPVQTTQAKELHCLAGIPKGASGLKELELFQKVLSPKYQIFCLNCWQATYDNLERICRWQKDFIDLGTRPFSLMYLVWRIFKLMLFLFWLRESIQYRWRGTSSLSRPKNVRHATVWNALIIRHKTPKLMCNKCHHNVCGADCYQDHKKSPKKDNRTMCDIFT